MNMKSIMAASSKVLGVKKQEISQDGPSGSTGLLPKEKTIDISNVRVRTNVYESIIGNFPNKKVVNNKSNTVNTLDESDDIEDKVQSLVERLSSLLVEAKTVIAELTSCGSIGVGPVKPLKKKKRLKFTKDGYTKINKRN
jgi:hypothetical protein